MKTSMNRVRLVQASTCLALLSLVAACSGDAIEGEVVTASSVSADGGIAPGPAPSGTPSKPALPPDPVSIDAGAPTPPQPPPPPPDGLSADCMTLLLQGYTEYRLGVLSLDTGALVQGPVFTMNGVGNNGSLAYSGGQVFVCTHGLLASIDRASGAFQKSQQACKPLTSNLEGIWSYTYPGEFTRYSGAPELIAQAPSGQVTVPIPHRLGRFGPGTPGHIYGSPGAGPTVYRIGTATATATPIALEGLGTSQVFGISASTQNRVAVATITNFTVGGVQIFDAGTGKRLAHLHPTLKFVGLSCLQ